MPATVAAALIAIGIGAATAAVLAPIIIGVVVSTALSVVIGFVQKALAPSPKAPDFGDFAFSARERTQNIRQPITTWRVALGLVKLGGPVTFVHTTDSNRHLNMLLTVACHPVSGFRAVYFNDELITLDGAGAATGRWGGVAWVWFGDGTAEGDADLLAALRTNCGDKWTTDHKQTGRAKLYVRFRWNVPRLSNGIPTVSVVLKGAGEDALVWDPRDEAYKFTRNPALLTAWYLRHAAFGLGEPESGIDETALIAAANICDEHVDVVEASAAVTADAASDRVTLAEAIPNLIDGDGVELASDGSPEDLPAPLASGTTYYWIGTPAGPLVGQLAESYEDALAGTAIDIEDAGTGVHTLTRVSEPRYACDGTFDTAEEPKAVLAKLLGSMAGGAVKSGGAWFITAGAWRAPSITLDDGDLAGPVRVTTRLSGRELFNGVKGVFVNPADGWQPTDFPPVTNATYLAADQGNRKWKDIALDFTISPSAAQRIAKIDLERARQQISAQWPVNLTGMRLRAGSTVKIDRARFGWSGKAFDIVDFALANRGDAEAPVLGVDLMLRETAEAVYDWSSGEETVVDPAPDTDLPDPFSVLPPASLDVTEELYETRGSAGVKARATLIWGASPDAFADRYEPQFKLSSASDWTPRALVNGLEAAIDDIAPGTYDFRVRAINGLGVESDWTARPGVEVQGLAAAPDDIEGLTIQAIGGMAVLRWTRHPDLDVRIGGKIMFRHDQLETGAAWNTSVSIGEAVSGDLTIAVLPLLPGTYFARAVDSSGILAENAASVSTKGAQVLAFSTLGTVSEHTAFSGAKDGTVVASGTLKLDTEATDQFDDIEDFDELDDLDDWGASGAGVKASGTYDFAAGIDLGSVKRVRLRVFKTVAAENVNDLIDGRGNIDEWLDVDGAVGADVDSQTWVQETDDDPNGSPVAWGPWQRLHAGEYEARGFQFQERLISNDPIYNINLTELTVNADGVS